MYWGVRWILRVLGTNWTKYYIHVESNAVMQNVPVNKITSSNKIAIGFDLHRAGSTGGMRLKRGARVVRPDYVRISLWRNFIFFFHLFSFFFYLFIIIIIFFFLFFGSSTCILYFCISLFFCSFAFVRLRSRKETELRIGGSRRRER